MTEPTAHVPMPALEWRDGVPVSTVFDDVYFSRAGGMAESAHVFLAGNGLPKRWQEIFLSGDGDLCVGHAEPPAAGARGHSEPHYSAERRSQRPRPDHDSCVASASPQGGSLRALGAVLQRREAKPPPSSESIFHFTIAELGFGTGLNFLVTMNAFRASAKQGARLHYIAIEKYPFTPEQLTALLAKHPELADEAKELIAAYPLRLPGIHRVHLGQVTLTLCFGDVSEVLREHLGFSIQDSARKEVVTAHSSAAFAYPESRTLNPECSRVNAWYLDGFSPAKNAAMWTPEIFEAIATLSAPGATFATFTAASHVRRGLEAAGFSVRKTRGFGHKREMLVGRKEDSGFWIQDSGIADAGSLKLRTEHYDRSNELRVGGDTPLCKILIIGAGIAGATLARALAERGYHVTVLERGTIASGASGNHAGVLFPQITKHWGTPSAWYFTAYSYALRQLQHWQAQGVKFEHQTCGMLRLPRHTDEEQLLQHLHETHGLDASIVRWLKREDASAQAGVELQTGGAYFPEGSWLNPGQLCAALLQHKNITVREQTAVKSLARAGDTWQLMLANGQVLVTQHCCITAAYESALLLADHGLTLGAVGGQVSEFAAQNAAAGLRSILCHKGYVIPLAKHLLVGATYHRADMDAVTAERHDENRAALAAIMPSLAEIKTVGGRSSIRATTPDRMPYVGAIDTGLYVATGFGSRGLLSAPMAAEIIASDMTGEPPPVTEMLLRAVNPLRFIKTRAFSPP